MRGTRLAELMDVIVLAGGFGTRLRPWTLHTPKPLIPILDRTMIEHVVNILPEEMVDKVLIAAGYGIEQMREHFAALDLPYEVIIVAVLIYVIEVVPPALLHHPEVLMKFVDVECKGTCVSVCVFVR